MKNLSSKIFIDGGDSQETKKAKQLLGFLDGQTTNPTLIAKNLKEKMSSEKAVRHPRGGRLRGPKGTSSAEGPMDSPGVEESVKPSSFTQAEALEEYKRIVQEMSRIIPQGSVSIQVFAEKETKAEEMLKQARERSRWIPNSSIKIPCVFEGLKAAEIACQEMPINITLAFSQSQAAAVYEATKGARYPVFISPFVGRLDDRGENGMDVVANILKMYEEGDNHVEVLTASVRHLGHIFRALELKSNIITIPFKVFKEWADLGFIKTPNHPRGSPDFVGRSLHYVGRRPKGFPRGEGTSKPLVPIPYRQNITLGKPWQSYNLHHDLTDIGIEKFAKDWNTLVG